MDVYSGVAEVAVMVAWARVYVDLDHSFACLCRLFSAYRGPGGRNRCSDSRPRCRRTAPDTFYDHCA